jgi:hypothetical protein
MPRPRRRPSPALIVAFLALLVSVSGVAFGTIPARDGDIHACYSKKSGDVEFVNTQRDQFGCPQNWRGLIIDTSPTSLESPDGRFKIEVSNSGATMSGPNDSVELNGSEVKVNGRKVTVASDTSVDVRASSITETASATIDLAAAFIRANGREVQTQQSP